MTKMNTNLKVQRTSGGVIHLGREFEGRLYGECGGQVYASGLRQNISGFRAVAEDTEVTCKRCLKKLQKAEDNGTFLKSVRNEDGSYRTVDIRKEDAEDAPKVKPGRCLQRVAKVGKTPTQCVKAHAHEDDHEDRFGQTFANHAIVPGAEPLSPTAQALADASKARDEAVEAYNKAATPAERAKAEEQYEAATALRWEAVNAHRKAREEAGDFLPRHEREARAELARLNAPRGSHPLGKRLAEDHGLNFF
jgi:hypothetical protein